MNIVITMAGRGCRFREAGYLRPKYEIMAHGRSLFEWAMLSLKNFLKVNNRVIFVCLAENGSEGFVRSHCRQLGIDDVHVVNLDSITDGQATSAYLSRLVWVSDEPLLIYNIDTFVNPVALDPLQIRRGSMGWIPCFRAPGENWSFVKVGIDGWAVDLAEKRRISDNSSIGLYWFSSGRIYLNAYEKYFGDPNNLVNGERYVAPLYREIIADGGQISMSEIAADDVHVLGTPAELNVFLSVEQKMLPLRNR